MRLEEFHQMALTLDQKGVPYAVVTVISTTGSSAAKAGAKALIGTEGQTLWGWVGGGCVENRVREAAYSCLQNGQPAKLTVDLQDELTSVPCGGSMELLVEPILPPPHLQLIGTGQVVESLRQFGRYLGFRVSMIESPAFDDLVGGAGTYCVVATHHKGDHLAIESCFEKKVEYIGLIASQHRTNLVKKMLLERGATPLQLGILKAPAGLDLGAKNPEEIALSIISEIVGIYRKTSKLHTKEGPNKPPILVK